MTVKQLTQVITIKTLRIRPWSVTLHFPYSIQLGLRNTLTQAVSNISLWLIKHKVIRAQSGARGSKAAKQSAFRTLGKGKMWVTFLSAWISVVGSRRIFVGRRNYTYFRQSIILVASDCLRMNKPGFKNFNEICYCTQKFSQVFITGI